jgi:hypothetical protein
MKLKSSNALEQCQLNENERRLRFLMLMNITYKKNGMRVSQCE